MNELKFENVSSWNLLNSFSIHLNISSITLGSFSLKYFVNTSSKSFTLELHSPKYSTIVINVVFISLATDDISLSEFDEDMITISKIFPNKGKGYFLSHSKLMN